MHKIIIMGAGVIGITSAYVLRQKGFDVTVIDSHESAGMGTSFANGGQLSYSKTGPLSSPATLLNLPFYLFSNVTPLHIKKFDAEFITWGIKFLLQSLPFNYSQNNHRITELALKSRVALHRIVQQNYMEFDYEKLGKMYIYREKKSFSAAQKFSAAKNKSGFKIEILTPQEAIEKEPALLHLENEIVGAAYSAVDESGDAKKFCEQMAKVCKENGVKFLWSTHIQDFVAENGRVFAVKTNKGIFDSENFVSCLGIESNSALKALGIRLPIYPMKGYSLTVPARDFAPKISVTDEAKKIVYSRLGDNLRIAGVAEFSGYNTNLNRELLDKILQDSKNCFPDAGDYTRITEWAGLRPMTPSCVPIIKKSEKFANLYFNTGHGMLGWTLAAGSAEELANLFK